MFRILTDFLCHRLRLLLPVLCVVSLMSGCISNQGNVNDRASVPQEPFLSFKNDLEVALTGKGIDPQHQNLHFVLLFNSTRKTGPDFKNAREIARGLMFHYLQPGDVVTIVPYQSVPDYDASVVAEKFTVENRNKLYGRVTPPSGDIDGHDDERTLLDLNRRIRAEHPKLADSTVYIQISDKEVSERGRDGAALITEKELQRQLSLVSLQRVEPRAYTGTMNDQVAWQVWIKTFLPDDLTPLGTFKYSRDDVRPWIIRHWKEIALGVVLAVFTICLGYWWWLTRPIRLYVGNTFRKMRFGQTLRISGPETGADRIEVPELPLGNNVAEIEVTLKRQVIVSGLDQFELVAPAVHDNQARVTPALQEFTVIERGGDHAGIFTVKLAK